MFPTLSVTGSVFIACLARPAQFRSYSSSFAARIISPSSTVLLQRHREIPAIDTRCDSTLNVAIDPPTPAPTETLSA